jgi:signal peptidase I
MVRRTLPTGLYAERGDGLRGNVDAEVRQKKLLSKRHACLPIRFGLYSLGMKIEVDSIVVIDPLSSGPADACAEPLNVRSFGQEHGWLCWLRQVVESLFPAVAIVLAVNLLLAQPRIVHGQSMEPSLHEDERVIVDLLVYRFRQPRRGEIIILDIPTRDDGPPLIKRVIGLPGDFVEIKAGGVYVNGYLLSEPYLDQLTTGNMAAHLVPEAHLFVLGDNRGSSNDSRYFGMVPYENVRGRAWLRYWPLQDLCSFKPELAYAQSH